MREREREKIEIEIKRREQQQGNRHRIDVDKKTLLRYIHLLLLHDYWTCNKNRGM